MQRFLGKMFSGISQLDTENEFKIINKMGSKEGEMIELCEKIDIEKATKVEDWLEQLERRMKGTLLELVCQSHKGWFGVDQETLLRFIE